MIVVPGQHISRDELVAQVHEELPLEDAAVSRDDVTEDIIYKPPPGKAFRMTGDFSIYCDSNDVPGEPTNSVARIKREHADLLDEFLEETKGDEVEALQLTYDEVYSYRLFSADEHVEQVHDFIGILLCIEVFGGKDDRPSRASISLRQITDARVANEFVGINLAQEGQRENIIYFPMSRSGVEWFSLQALGDFGECAIELVDYEEPEPEPVLDAEQSEAKELYVPKNGATSDDIINYRNMSLRLSLSPQEREEWKRQIVREYREVRMPLEDDPLKDLIIIEGEIANDLEALVEAVRESQKPKKHDPEDIPF